MRVEQAQVKSKLGLEFELCYIGYGSKERVCESGTGTYTGREERTTESYNFRVTALNTKMAIN